MGASIVNMIEYYWKTRIDWIARYTMCGVCCILSLITVWSELTFFSKNPTLSVWALLVNIQGLGNFGLQIFIIFILSYIAYCAYSTLLSFQILRYFRLVTGGYTDANSLMFSAAYLCRLVFSMSWNFLFLVHYGQNEIHTAFVEVMGLMNVVPVFGNYYFNAFFPASVLLICILVAFNIHKKKF